MCECLPRFGIHLFKVFNDYWDDWINQVLLVYYFRPQVSSALFFSYNTALGPPYRVIVDTNFINFSIQNKVCSLRLRIRCFLFIH